LGEGEVWCGEEGGKTGEDWGEEGWWGVRSVSLEGGAEGVGKARVGIV